MRLADAALHLEDGHCRTTVRPAKHVLMRLGIGNPADLAALVVGDTARDGSFVIGPHGEIRVPSHLRRALVRQRLHAAIIGQGRGDQYLSFDGSAVSPGALS